MMQILATEEEIKALGFDPKVLACKCCGVVRVDLLFLQRMRGALDLLDSYNVWITSCSRCYQHHEAEYKRSYPDNWHNKITKASLHLISGPQGEERIAHAMDFGGKFHDLQVVSALLVDWRGGFSFYNRGPNGGSSIHLDDGPRRRW